MHAAKQTGRARADSPVVEHVARAIAAARLPGLHFPGFFLGLHTHRLERERGMSISIPSGPHCTNLDGTVNFGAIAVVSDLALGGAMRAHLSQAMRMATLTLQFNFTGIPARGEIRAESRFDGLLQGISSTQGRVSGEVYADGKLLIRATGAFGTPPAPPGAKMHDVPWFETHKAQQQAPLPAKELHERERAILRRARAAARAAEKDAEHYRIHGHGQGHDRHGHSFIEHFWSQLPKQTKDGAECTVPLALHNGNRVGHAQGGVLFAMAVATAQRAVPTASVLTSATAWYIRAGTGHKLKVRSRILQHGRTVCVVQTQIRDAEKHLVLEVLTTHAYPEHHVHATPGRSQAS